jgi:hypothetical protein
MSDTKKKIESLVEALDESPVDDEEAKAAVEELGIDVKSFAARVREKVAAAEAAHAKKRIADARRALAEEVERLERRKMEPKKSREEQLATFRALLAKAPPQAVAMHFHKYESASDEDLAELIRALRHLLGEDDPE